MRRALAAWLNSRGSQSIDSGKASRGEHFYKWASTIDPLWSAPWYNLGLRAKNTGSWKENLRFNQRALELNPTDEAAWWNLGIAATALQDWPEARRAWKAYGINLEDGVGEVLTPAVTACVRLDPGGVGEVVWGERLDPARIEIQNVPLPESGHRYHDIVLNDGAANGTRTDENGSEVPVFDELAIWKLSDYSTYRVALRVPSKDAERGLVELCDNPDIGLEDWSTIRFVCSECSKGNLSPHDCGRTATEHGYLTFGFAARSLSELEATLARWVNEFPDADSRSPQLVLSAKPQ